MPNIDEGAKAWELAMARRVGIAVKARREALKMTAVRLAERTKNLGYPISRVTVTKIENNTRAGKVDVAELLVLAAALNMPPALLLFPNYPDTESELLPELNATGAESVEWLSGAALLPPKKNADGSFGPITRSNPGVELVGAISHLRALRRTSIGTISMLASGREDEADLAEETRQLIAQHTRQVEQQGNIAGSAHVELWGLEDNEGALDDLIK